MENKEKQTTEEFIREKIRERNSFPEKYVMEGLQRYSVTGEDCLRWSHEYSNQENNELQNSIKFKDDYIQKLANENNAIQKEINALKEVYNETKIWSSDLAFRVDKITSENEILKLIIEDFKILQKDYAKIKEVSDNMTNVVENYLKGKYSTVSELYTALEKYKNS